MTVWFRTHYRPLVLSGVAVFLMSGMASRMGMPAGWAVGLSVFWVALIWGCRALVSRWQTSLGRPTAWAAVILLFGMVGLIAGSTLPLCEGACQSSDKGTLVLMFAMLPVLVLVYTGPVMWLVTRVRRMRSRSEQRAAAQK